MSTLKGGYHNFPVPFPNYGLNCTYNNKHVTGKPLNSELID